MKFENTPVKKSHTYEEKESQETKKPSFFRVGKKAKGIALALAAGLFTGCTSKVEGFGVVSPDGLKKKQTAI
ncbi:MAG: hypothetical protein Q7R79_02745, partial [bacterium]|nr:hypothetical protein [bacterium]